MSSISISDVSVSFPLYHTEGRSLKKAVLAAASGRLGKDAKRRVVVEALRDVSFALETGDRLGFVGSNGAGKTTLLRTLAGIYEPVNGYININGKVTALLDPGQGMNAELTGRENIRLRGLFSRLNPGQINQLEDDVAAFAGLDQFLDLPVRMYSSGMVVRLGFGLATSIKPQILLMDEWLMAGDANFMEKALKYLSCPRTRPILFCNGAIGSSGWMLAGSKWTPPRTRFCRVICPRNNLRWQRIFWPPVRPWRLKAVRLTGRFGL
jgi:lipopolysaccharide transport system ATP-binding protein